MSVASYRNALRRVGGCRRSDSATSYRTARGCPVRASPRAAYAVSSPATGAIGSGAALLDRLGVALPTNAGVEQPVAGVVLSGAREFWLTLTAYLPAAVGILVVYVSRWRQVGPWWWGIIGVLLTFIAAGVQVGHVALHPQWFNHNALYHLVQAVALFAIARAAGARTAENPHALG